MGTCHSNICLRGSDNSWRNKLWRKKLMYCFKKLCSLYFSINVFFFEIAKIDDSDSGFLQVC